MITTLQEVLNSLKRLSKTELEDVRDEVEETILDKEYEEKKKNVKNRAQIIRDFNHFGFIVPDGAKFWRINGPFSKRGSFAYGMEVGGYTHSCHVDDTDLKVLLVVDGKEHFVECYADLWLSGPF